MFQLTKDGEPRATIVLGSRATWLDCHAAEELRSYLCKISGATLNITQEKYISSLIGNKILVGLPSGHDGIRAFAGRNPGLLPAESTVENDCVAYAVRGDTLVISGSNSRSVYYSICHLLQKEFGVGFYWDRDVFVPSTDLALPEETALCERSAFKIRHSIGQWVYNHGAFLNKAERRAELDKYARNKINSYRLYSWNSYARKKTLQALGLTGIEITQEDIARRDCVRDTIEYAHNLGIEVMVPLIPDELTQEFRELYPQARCFGSEWVKDDNAAPQTVPCLYPDDPMYKTLVQTFIKVWMDAYGPAGSFVCAPPQEHHISASVEEFIKINIDYPKYTYEALHELIPTAKLFYDGWGVRADTPPSIWSMPSVMQRFVDNLPQEVYFLDLWPDRAEFGDNFCEPMYRDTVYGPLRKAHYVLELLNEFGGDDQLHGHFGRCIDAAKEMTDPAAVTHGDGFGNCTELCGVSLHFFDLIFQLAWQPGNITVDSFLADTARRRYGNLPAETGLRAMQDLLQAVYCERYGSHAKYQKRCYLARIQRAFVPLKDFRETARLLDDFMQTMTALPDAAKTDAIGQDMYDVMRQYITEYFNMHLCCLLGLFLQRKTAENLHTEFEHHAAILEQLLNELEALTRENPAMYVETIVRQLQGRPCDPDVSGADCPAPADFRAWMRDMGTTFVRTIPNLPDYDSQDYHELICYYYHPRMTACIDTLRSLLDDNGTTDPKAVDTILEQRYKVVEDYWIDVGYPVTDECEGFHLPLWRAAQNVWNMLHVLPLDAGLAETDTGTARQAADVFASFSAEIEEEEERAWLSNNPFAEDTEE